MRKNRKAKEFGRQPQRLSLIHIFIYANLTASGAVTGVYAVNSFSVQAGDTVADHGSYTAVRNICLLYTSRCV